MKFKYKSVATSAAAALVIVGALALPSLAQMGPHHGRSLEGPNPFFLMRAATLSDAQKATVKTIVQTNRQNNQPIISQLLPLRQQFNSTLFTTGAADTNLLAEINALESQLQQSRLTVFQQVWSQVLNPTQQSQVGAAFAQFQANRAQPQSDWWSFRQPQNQ